MATRSNINVKVGDVYHCIYCHWDGYPSHHSPILTGHYNSQELAEKLVSQGYISSLDESCDQPEGHSFETRIDGYTVYYGRDRGEKNVDFKVLTTPLEEEEFSYTWDGEKWLCDGVAILPEENAEIDTTIAKSVVAGQIDVTVTSRPTATEKTEYTVIFGSKYSTFIKADAMAKYRDAVEMQLALSE